MTTRSARPALAVLGAGLSLALLAACGGQGTAAQGTGDTPTQNGSTAPAVRTSAATITSNIRRGADAVDLTRRLRLHVSQGTFSAVQVSGPGGAVLRGAMSPDKTSWVSSGRLQQASSYHVIGKAADSEGLEQSYQADFRTRALTLDEQTFPSMVPLQGQTVGVGMPVIIRFDVPVTDHAAIQKHLQVISSPAQPGAFNWISDNEVHWRPATYWKPGTNVTVKADIGGVPAGNGIYGQKDRQMSFHVGRSMISKVDISTDQMKVFQDGRLIRTIPVTTGRQPDFTTRSGVKVIVEKLRHTRMNSETIGIDPNSTNGYNLDDVQYAMRVTYSGEFVHAAPWSVADQGRDNVSHGCTGMSMANAAWLYQRSLVGDVVEYTGTSKMMSLTNGYGDWNESFATYRAGSAS